MLCLQRTACHGVLSHNGAISSTTKQLLWLLHTQPKSKHSQASIVLTWGIFGDSSRHTSARNKIFAAFYALHKLSHSIQLDAYSPSLLNLPVRKCYAQLPSLNVTAETQLLPFVQRCARSCCSSWLTVVIQAHAGCQKLSCTKILLTFHMRPTAIALNYSVKNIRNDVRQIIIIWKIAIQLTSVGLAHARPNHMYIPKVIITWSCWAQKLLTPTFWSSWTLVDQPVQWLPHPQYLSTGSHPIQDCIYTTGSETKHRKMYVVYYYSNQVIVISHQRGMYLV